MAKRFKLYLIDDTDDCSPENDEVMKYVMTKLNCNPLNPDREFNAYWPKFHDVASEKKYTAFFNAINQSEKILYVQTPWNTHLKNDFQGAAFYNCIEKDEGNRFIIIFIGYSTNREALSDCPDELRNKTKIIFSQPWKDDHENWDRLKRSLTPAADQGPLNFPVQCTDTDSHADIENRLLTLARMSTISSDVLIHPGDAAEDGAFRRPGYIYTPDQQSEYSIPSVVTDGPGPLSTSRHGGLFPDSDVDTDGVTRSSGTDLQLNLGQRVHLPGDVTMDGTTPTLQSRPGITSGVRQGDLFGPHGTPQMSDHYPPGTLHNTEAKTVTGASWIGSADSGFDNLKSPTQDITDESADSLGAEEKSSVDTEVVSFQFNHEDTENELSEDGIALVCTYSETNRQPDIVNNRQQNPSNEGMFSKTVRGLWEWVTHF